MGSVKTNAMRMLDRAKIAYKTHSYKVEDGAVDGITAAEKLCVPPEKVFKTLVTQGADRQYFVFVVPVECELDLKKAARAVGEKHIEMIPVKDLNKVTGYIRGGCSPVGMKKAYGTVIDCSCGQLSEMLVSAGKIGQQIELAPQDLIAMVNAKTADLVRE